MDLRFPQRLTPGKKGMLDGLSLEYLRSNFGFKISPPRDEAFSELPPWMTEIWWWRASGDERLIPMQQPSARLYCLKLPDGGAELGFRYECLSRALGRYLFDLPFTQLRETELVQFHEMSGQNVVGITPVPSVKIWGVTKRPNQPQVHPNHYFDPAIESPRGNGLDGEVWSNPRVLIFNLKRPNNVIVKEFEELIATERERAGCPAPPDDQTTRFNTMKLLEYWDIKRWEFDSRQTPNQDEFTKLIELAGIKANPSKISRLRELTLLQYPQFAGTATNS